MTKQINEPTDTIAAALTRWKRNRDIIAGEDAVKAAGEKYLPKLGSQSETEYRKYLARVPYFPGASRTHDGLLGLVTRKDGVLKGPAGLDQILQTITHSGHTVDDLAEEVFSETLKTGFTGLLVDHPATSEALTVKAAIDGNYRPFVAIYPAESILEVQPGVVQNRQRIVRVRLLEDGETVRELRLDDGIYSVTIHRKIEERWVADEPVIPMRSGKPLTDIPFVLVAPKVRTFEPVKGPLDDVCLLNLHLYHEQADAKNSRFYSSAPILTVKGAKENPDLVIGPGTVVYFPDHTQENPVEFEFTEFSGAGQTTLENAVATLKDEMAKLGSNILASEKSAAEAAETHAIRRSSENSVLASLARTVSRKIEEALTWVTWWMGREAVTFQLNTDFIPSPMTAEERKAALAEFMSGAISQATYFDMLIAGEVLPEAFDTEAEAQRLAADSSKVDRPAEPHDEG